MSKKVENNEQKPFIKTKQRSDNGYEVTVSKSPAKTKTGKVLVWIISACTLVLPIAGLIFLLIEASK